MYPVAAIAWHQAARNSDDLARGIGEGHNKRLTSSAIGLTLAQRLEKGGPRRLFLCSVRRERILGKMARDDLVAMEGKVVEVLVGGNFRVNVDGGHSVLAHLAGRMRRNRIRVVLGDQVTVAVSPYDPTRGLITFRAK